MLRRGPAAQLGRWFDQKRSQAKRVTLEETDRRGLFYVCVTVWRDC